VQHQDELSSWPQEPTLEFTLASSVLVGLYYGSSLIAGIITLGLGLAEDDQENIDSGWRLTIPIIGPVYALYASETSHDDSIAGWTWLFTIIQAVSFALMIYDIVIHVRHRRRTRENATDVEDEVATPRPRLDPFGRL